MKVGSLWKWESSPRAGKATAHSAGEERAGSNRDDVGKGYSLSCILLDSKPKLEVHLVCKVV